MNVWWVLLATVGHAWFYVGTRPGRSLSPWMPGIIAACWSVYFWLTDADAVAVVTCTLVAVWLLIYGHRLTRRRRGVPS